MVVAVGSVTHQPVPTRSKSPSITQTPLEGKTIGATGGNGGDGGGDGEGGGSGGKGSFSYVEYAGPPTTELHVPLYRAQ